MADVTVRREAVHVNGRRWPRGKFSSLDNLKRAVLQDAETSVLQKEVLLAKIDQEYQKVLNNYAHVICVEICDIRRAVWKSQYRREHGGLDKIGQPDRSVKICSPASLSSSAASTMYASQNQEMPSSTTAVLSPPVTDMSADAAHIMAAVSLSGSDTQSTFCICTQTDSSIIPSF